MQNQLQFFDYGGKATVQSQDIYAIGAAMSGDIIAVISPTTKSTAHASAVTRNVTVTLTDSNSNVHTWCNKAITTIVTIADTGASGTASVASSTITFVNGVATIVVTLAGTWSAADTDTLTIANMTILGVTVTGGTSVETMT